MRLLLLLAVFCGFSAFAQAQSVKQLDTKEDWIAYSFFDTLTQSWGCSVDTLSREGGDVRAEVFYPQDHSHTTGYLRFNLEPDQFLGAELYIDGDLYPLYLVGDHNQLAYVQDNRDLSALRALRWGYRMELYLEGRGGKFDRYDFSLFGFTAMYGVIAEACEFDARGVIEPVN